MISYFTFAIRVLYEQHNFLSKYRLTFSIYPRSYKVLYFPIVLVAPEPSKVMEVRDRRVLGVPQA